MLVTKVVLRALVISVLAIGTAASAAIARPPTTRTATLAPEESRTPISQALLPLPVSAHRISEQARSGAQMQREHSGTDFWLKCLLATALVGYQLRRKHRSLTTHSFGR